MKLGRSIAAHGILAAGGLVLAYLVWTDDDPQGAAEDSVTIFDCDPDAVQRVDLTIENKDVALELRSEGRSRVAWITVTRRPENREPETERFIGSKDAVDEWLKQFAPLRARRSLGELDDEQLNELGLSDPKGRLTIACGERRATFQLGGRSFGAGDRYVRAERGGPVHLLANDRLGPLESAESRLMERQLHTFEWRDVVSLVLTAFGQQKELLHRNRLDAQGGEWVDATQPDRRDDTYGNWLSRFPVLRVQRYLGPDAEPGSDLDGMSVAPERVMRVEYRGERGELGSLELVRVDGTERTYYARSETTRSWVRVPTSVAQQIEDDLRSMLGVAPLERPSAPTPAAGGDAGTPEGDRPDAGTP